MKYKNFSILIALSTIFLGPILATQGYFKLLIKLLLSSNSNAIAYLQYIGSLLGGSATLIALYITVKQTRNIQKDNKEQAITVKEIDKLKMQIEYSKSAFEYSYEYELLLENIDKSVEKILRRTDLMLAKEDDELDDVGYKKNYETMKKEKEILLDLDVEQQINKIFNKIDKYSKKIMIATASITNEEINSSVEILFDLLSINTEFLGKIVYENKNIDEAMNLIKAENSSINLTLSMLITFQFQLSNHIRNCQNRINKLIS